MTGTSTATPSEAKTSSRFNAAVNALLKAEGGLVDNPADPGGVTKYGISLRFLVSEGRIAGNGALFDIDRNGKLDGADVRAISWLQASLIYEHCFWEACDLGGLVPPIDAMMLDQCVNMGPGTAIRLLQHAVLATATGRLDAATFAAIGRAVKARGAASIVVRYKALAHAHYRAIVALNPKLARFAAGWSNRVDRLGRV